MKTVLALLLAGLAAPALAQGNPDCSPEHAAMGHCTPAAPAGASPPADEHSGHADEAPKGDEHAGHPAEAAQPPVGPPPAAASSGPEHAADSVYGIPAMAGARKVLRREHGGLPAYRVFFDRAETRLGKGRDSFLVDGEAWFGGDIDKAWVKAELEGEWGEGVEGAQVQGLWSHAVDPWFDLQAGVRYDPRRGPDRAHLVLGLQGLAPYWWEVDGAIFLSHKGELTARAEGEHDLRITQKLILQPRAELNLSLQDIPELRTGTGLTSAAIGARLRYQLTPLFAAYVGVEYEQAFGKTRRYLREDGDDPGRFNLLAGVRVWL